ncbi:serine hydrolase domain-containing protein [Cellulosilyticum sp. I15G10I2]|uniref:serine hydrolase domain-containing protein n=1 Tax=Cellulosilyticum sp. I15G10I2 TaxID=1892843 RepID=UPI00085C463D|nr:serine hydrolase [Cellulosilyticum sp. I15G10I2]
MNKSILNQFRLTVAEKGFGIYGIKVQRINGESMSHRWRSDDPVCIYSAAKTIASLAVGLCIQDKQFAVNDKVLDFFPEYRILAAPGSEAIEIRDLLHMASGKLAYWFNSDEHTMMTNDWAELFFKVPVTKEPGTFFYYSNACTYMLGRIVERISGKNLRDFLVSRLFIPLEIFNPQWHSCPQGHSLAASGLYLTTDQFARVGEMLLNKGSYKDRQIISKNYINDAISDTIDNKRIDPTNAENSSGYGYQIWKCAFEGAYRMDGKYGQLCIVIPSKGAVITVTAHEEKAKNDIIHAVFEDIVHQLD